MQSEVDTGVELARFCDGFSRPLMRFVLFAGMYLPPPLLPYSPYSMLHKAWLTFVGLGSPLKCQAKRGRTIVPPELVAAHLGNFMGSLRTALLASFKFLVLIQGVHVGG